MEPCNCPRCNNKMKESVNSPTVLSERLSVHVFYCQDCYGFGSQTRFVDKGIEKLSSVHFTFFSNKEELLDGLFS